MAGQFSNNGEVLDYVNYMLGKDMLGKYITPDEYMTIGNEVQLEQLNEEIKNFEATRETTIRLAPFTKTAGDDENPPLTLNAYGKVAFPADLAYPARGNYLQYLNKGCSATAKYRQIIFTPQDFYGGAMNMPMMNPESNSKEVPGYAVVESGKIKVTPASIKTFSMTYIRFPKPVYFDYDEINGEVVYLPPGNVHVNSSVLPVGSPSLSVEFEWDQDVLTILANKILEKSAVNIRSQFVQVASKTQMTQ